MNPRGKCTRGDVSPPNIEFKRPVPRAEKKLWRCF